MKTILSGILPICLLLAAGCSQSAGPSPEYSDLSKKVDNVMQRTKGDPSKLTPEDQKVIAQAKSVGMITPPGY